MKQELLRADCFHLEIDGISAGGFLRCQGLAARREVLAYAEGGAAVPRVFPGAARWANVVLEAGLTRGRDLYDWFSSAEPRDVAVVLLAADGEERARWELARAWPCRWEGPELDAGGPSVAVEVVELAHEGVLWNQR